MYINIQISKFTFNNNIRNNITVSTSYLCCSNRRYSCQEFKLILQSFYNYFFFQHLKIYSCFIINGKPNLTFNFLLNFFTR